MPDARPQRPRILYSFPHPIDRPGIANTALQQVLGLARAGAHVVLFCTSVGTAVLPPEVEVHETMVIAGRRVPHRLIGVQRAYDFHDGRVARWLTRHSANIDVVHAWPRGCLKTLLAANRLGVVGLRESPNPHTASVIRESASASADAGVPLPADHSHAANAAVLAKEQAEYEAAVAVLVPSDYAREEFLAEGFPEGRLIQHRYGCDLGAFPARGERRAGPLRAVFIGRGDPTKGLHVGLEAWRLAAVEGGEFRIAGRVQPDYAATMGHDLGLPGVEQLGFVDDVPSLLADADVLVLPSWTEGSALVILEAQASGCLPLVSSASGPIGREGVDYLEHRVGDAAGLAEQLRRLADTPSALADAARHLTSIRPTLSWDAAATRLLECYAEALERVRRGPGA